jgi:hypothetical protein
LYFSGLVEDKNKYVKKVVIETPIKDIIEIKKGTMILSSLVNLDFVVKVPVISTALPTKNTNKMINAEPINHEIKPQSELANVSLKSIFFGQNISDILCCNK